MASVSQLWLRSQAAQPQGWRRDPARRPRQAPAEPHAGPASRSRPRPYERVANEAGITEQEAIGRVKRLLDERIIRQVTPIFDTRALGYSSMLVAAKVDPENPWRAANVINEHPGVSHNYLRNHEFNIWFTIATEPDSPLGLDGTLEALAQEAGAESVRQLPTLKLFKIRMDLEMEGGTDALAKAVEVAPPAETERQPYDEFDIAVIRATQGDMPVIPEPYAPAADKLGISQDRLLAHLQQMQERRLLRRVAAILFHRRAGFSANGMGVWKVPDEQIMELGPRMAAFRGISHCYQRPTYEDWPYSVFTMAHGRSKDECDAILDSIADPDRDRRPRDALLLDRVQEDPAALLHRRASRLGTRARGRVSAPAADPTARSSQLYRRALALLPGGVNSPVRAMRSIGRDPIFIASRPRFDDHRRRRQRVHRLGLLVGAADPRARRTRTSSRGHRGGRPAGRHSARPPKPRWRSPRRSPARIPSVEMMRMTSSGTEATMSAIRLARAVTGRDKILKFAGAYHGHVDGLLAEAGSGLATQGIPASPGVPEAAAAATIDRAVERPGRVGRRDRAPRARGDPGRAGPGQHGRRPAGAGLPRAAPPAAPTSAGRC